MKVLQLKSYRSSHRFTPRSIIRLAAVGDGLDLCFGDFREVPFGKVRMLAVVAFGSPRTRRHLMLFIEGYERPMVVAADDIDFENFPFVKETAADDLLRQLVVYLAQQNPWLSLPQGTADFLNREVPQEVHPVELPGLATSMMAALEPELAKELQPIKTPPPGSKKTKKPLPAAEPEERKTYLGLDSPLPPPPLLPPFSPSLRYGAARSAELLKSFEGELPQLGSSLRFSRLLLPVAAYSLLLLPILYFALIAGLSYGVYAVASTHGQKLIELSASGEARDAGSLAFLLTIALFVFLIYVLLTPLFIKSHRDFNPLALKRAKETVLFSFIERLAKVLQAPNPKRIEVVSDADVALGLREREDGKEWVLTLGLPLVAGLTLEQLTGVLAAEFVRYSRRPGSRWIQAIVQANHRLAQLVIDCAAQQEKRSADLDERLRGGGLGRSVLGGLVSLVSDLARFIFFAVVRGVVVFFAKLGEWISGAVMRRLANDIERYQRRLVGREVLQSIRQRREGLRHCHQEFLLELDDVDKDSAAELTDHLPGMVVYRSLLQEAQESAARPKGQAASDSAAAPLPAPSGKTSPIFHSPLPANVLFRDFVALSRQMSSDLYRSFGIRRPYLEPIERFLENQWPDDPETEALHRYFGGSLVSRRPVPVAPVLKVDERPVEKLVANLRAARERFVSRLPAHWDLLELFDVAVDCRLGALEGLKLIEAGFEVEPQGVGGEEWNSMEAEAAERMRDVSTSLADYEKLSGQRLMAALVLISTEERAMQLPRGDIWFREVPQLLTAIAEINRNFRELLQLRDLHAVFVTLKDLDARQDQDRRMLMEIFEREMDALYPPLEALYRGLAKTRNLFHYAGHDLGLSVRGVANDYFELSGEVLHRIYDLYFRSLGRLAYIAENIELAAGLHAFPDREPFPETRPWRRGEFLAESEEWI